MKKLFKNKFVTLLAILALIFALIGGTLALTESDGVSGAVNKVYNAYAKATAQRLNDETGTTYYVSPDAIYDADGTTADGTKDNPYHVYDVFGYYYDANNWNSSHVSLSAGDTVIFLEGTYNLQYKFQITVNGTYNNYIILKTEDGASSNAVLSFYEMAFLSTNRGVEMNGDYIYWFGINICGAGDNGLYVAGNYNIVENSEFYNNRDTGLQLGREKSDNTSINEWPNYNLIKNCTSYNNYDNETYGENADGFAAKLTVGYGNIFDGCIAYRNSDDGWDLYAKTDSGNIGAVIIYNCVAFENGYLMESQETCNARFSTFDHDTYDEIDTSVYTTKDGDGNGFKLGGSVMEGEVLMYNCMSFNNRMHGVTDNSNPGTLVIDGVTSYNNAADINNTTGVVDYSTSGATTESCNNIDVARQTYSYNVVKNVLSVTNGNSTTGSDVYRGSVANSMFDNGYQVTDPIDADTNSNVKGTAYTQASADDIFTALPALNMGTNCGTYDSATQTYQYTIHSQYRNSDGSINMGNILAIKDQDILDAGIGCVLNKDSWDDYTHYDYTYLNTCTSSDDAQATAIKNMMYVPVNTDACYQDFQLVNQMMSVSITWESDNSDVIAIGETATVSYSKSSMIDAVVYRQDADTQVTLTASVTVGSSTYTKDFVITVKAAEPAVGDIEVEGVEDDMIIIDQYTLMNEPEFSVLDASDYNGKTLSESQYTVKTTYKYASDKNSTWYNVPGYTSSVPGIYQLTITATLNDGSSSTTYVYNIYVASTTTTVEFTTDDAGNSSDTLTVNKDGFIIEGEPSNITGILYLLTKTSGATAPTASEIIASGEKYEFRTETISAQFENANSAGYDVYYVLTDTSGDHVSAVYSKSVETVSISTVSDFESMLSSNSSTKIYLLANDIDFENAAVTTSKTSFVGLFNGMGYTIKNATAEQGIFLSVKGGTIENVKFDNIYITGSEQKSGLIGEMNGGYVYNVAITDINVNVKAQRVGGLIGQVTSSTGATSYTYIQNVSIVNSTGYEINNNSNVRAAGIIGYIQQGGTSSSTPGTCIIYISDCLVYSTISGQGQVAGIVGSFDDNNTNDYLSIMGCVVGGDYTTTADRLGGILGYHAKGNGTVRISNCVSVANLYYKGQGLVTTAEKNCSGILGGYSSTADCEVTNCFAKFEEHNSNYDVTTTAGNANLASFWLNTPFDFTSTWTLCETDASGYLVAPYVTLNFIAVS